MLPNTCSPSWGHPIRRGVPPQQKDKAPLPAQPTALQTHPSGYGMVGHATIAHCYHAMTPAEMSPAEAGFIEGQAVLAHFKDTSAQGGLLTHPYHGAWEHHIEAQEAKRHPMWLSGSYEDTFHANMSLSLMPACIRLLLSWSYSSSLISTGLN